MSQKPKVVPKTLFPGQGEGERVFLLIRKHWFNYLIFGLFAFLTILPLVLALFYWDLIENIFGSNISIAIMILTLYVLTLLAIQLYGFVSYYLDVYIVTDRRIVDIEQSGFFKREISELHLREVQDVSAKVKGVFETLLHFGDVFIQTAGERENFIFQSIPHPYSIAKQIIDLHEGQLPRNRVLTTDKNAEYPDHDPESSHLLLGDLEHEAKKLLKTVNFADRFKSSIFSKTQIKSEDKKSPIAPKKQPPSESATNREQISENAKLEGQLSEGREIDL